MEEPGYDELNQAYRLGKADYANGLTPDDGAFFNSYEHPEMKKAQRMGWEDAKREHELETFLEKSEIMKMVVWFEMYWGTDGQTYYVVSRTRNMLVGDGQLTPGDNVEEYVVNRLIGDGDVDVHIQRTSYKFNDQIVS